MNNIKRYFNTSGPCNPKEHYTLMRQGLIAEGVQLVENSRYFTIWAPRQTGKSTYFRLLKTALNDIGYAVVHMNVENYCDIKEDMFLEHISDYFLEDINLEIKSRCLEEFGQEIKKFKDKELVFIIDEIEG